MAAELVGGALLSAALQALFDKLGSPQVLPYLQGKSKRCNFNDLLEKLKLHLNLIRAVLDDAEWKRTKSRSIDEWLDTLEEAFYDADDLLNEIEADALQSKVEAESMASSSKVRKSKREKLRNFFTGSWKKTLKDEDMESQIKKILERLEYIASQVGVLDLVKGTVRERSSWRPSSTSLVDESEVCGRDDDKKQIIKSLLSAEVGDERVTVIPIVGMGGVGKTTLAQAVFNDGQVKEHFELTAWVCVSEDFDIFRVTKTVLAAVFGNSYDSSMDLNLVQVKLKETLAGKKFLIILDDVWNEKYTYLVAMMEPFKDGAQGSKIIVTTRSEDVASAMGARTVPTHRLKELDEEVCWQLFAKHAFGRDDFAPKPDLERIGRKIVKKCNGLPLAAKTLGGLLRSKKSISQWEGISKSEIWELPDDRSDILPALRLSYHYQPSHLKQCFAYCSIFPKDFQFEKEDLVLLWMAEDLLEQPKKDKTIEEVGNEYFDELVCRSFFQKPEAQESSFVMHDLISDLAKFVSRKYYFRLENGNLDKIETKTRHLACVMAAGERHDLCESFKPIIEATRLRTFLQLKSYERTCSLLEVVLKLRSLRVLSLSGYGRCAKLPDSIGELRQLRYLNLSSKLIDRLPESICTLYNLQTLKLAYCRQLAKLPAYFHLLVNLRYLDIENSGLVDMPTQMGKLKSLQNSSTFIVGKDNAMKIGELGELLDLKGRLVIKNLQNVVTAMDASEAKLRDKKYLEELEFEWGEGETDDSEQERQMDVLDHLLPGTALKKLKITRYGGKKFPNWLGGQLFYNIVDIRVKSCKYCESLPPLGQLPSLKYLEIEEFEGLVRVGSQFYGNNSSSSFVSLEILKLGWMPNWEEWSIPSGYAESFQKLRELSIWSCEKLTGYLPCFLPSLEEITIDHCPQLSSSLPMMPDIQRISLLNCDRLVGGYDDVVKSFGCLQDLTISQSLDSSTTCKPLSSTLKKLRFWNSKNLEIPPRHSYDFPNLTELQLYNCQNVINSRMSWNLQALPNLRRFRICDCRFENNNLESFPEEGFLPRTIKELVLENLNWLKTLDSDGLQQLASLTSLSIHLCHNLQTITKIELPSSLQMFHLFCCPLLKEKCEREKGMYWNKISHIPRIFID